MTLKSDLTLSLRDEEIKLCIKQLQGACDDYANMPFGEDEYEGVKLIHAAREAIEVLRSLKTIED